MTIDAFVPLQSRYVDIGLGGSVPFTFTTSSNVSWLHFSSKGGSLTQANPEMRVEVTVDWSKIQGVQVAEMNFTATAEGTPKSIVPIFFQANHTLAPSGFSGIVLMTVSFTDSQVYFL
jgi:hypothetical protein